MLEAKWTQIKTNKNLGSRSIPYWHAFLSRKKKIVKDNAKPT